MLWRSGERREGRGSTASKEGRAQTAQTERRTGQSPKLQTLKILYTKSELEAKVNDLNPDFIFLTEAWCNSQINQTEAMALLIFP